MTLRLVDPTIGTPNEVVPPAPRLRSLDGKVVGLVDNCKTHGGLILRRIAENLARKYDIAGTRHHRKQQVSMPLDEGVVESFAEECGAILAAVGD
jgi:hypothetical protein